MLDRLRIRRHYKWVAANPGQMVFGGTIPLKLEHQDELGYLDENNEFKSIPIIDMPKPEHPEKAARREQQTKMDEAINELIRRNGLGHVVNRNPHLTTGVLEDAVSIGGHDLVSF